MDNLKIVENIQRICKERGTNPTVAGRESGAGETMVTNLKRKGTLPSIEKMQLLARYLGVTTSELLGEEKAPSPATDESEERLLILYRRLNQEGRDKLLDYADDLAESGKYKKASAFHVGTKEV